MDEEPLGGQPLPPPPPLGQVEPPLSPAPPAPPAPAARPPFTVRLLIRDTFARFAADWKRLLLVAGALGAVTLVIALLQLGGLRDVVATDPYAAIRNLPSLFVFGLIQLVVSLVGTFVLFALAGGGRAITIGAAVRQGLRRTLPGCGVIAAIVLIVMGLALVAFIVPSLVFGLLRAPILGFLASFLAVLAVYLFAFRLTLAIPAVVIDELGVGESLRVSRWVTKGSGIWLRMFGAALILGLLVGGASFSLAWLPYVVGPVLGLIPSLVETAIVTPAGVLFAISAYRRLVPPGGFRPSVDLSTAHFVEPVYGQGARRLFAASVVLAVIGLVSIPFTLQAMFSRLAPYFPVPGGSISGMVSPGEVVFGSTVTARACAVASPRSSFSHTESFSWVAVLPSPATSQDKVQLRASRDGNVLGVIDEPAGFYICLSPAAPETGFLPGTYLYEVLVNGQVKASGTVVIT